jgi:DNA polymerase-3 subunit delta'
MTTSHLTKLAVAITKQRLAHALLFISEDKEQLMWHAKELAAMLLCKNLGNTGHLSGSCKICNSCQRVWQSQHPNVHVLNRSGESADDDNADAEIKIDRIRELNAANRLKGYEEGAQIFILENAHLLTKQAANALLKTLEEPYSGRTFVLLAPSLFSVIPTITSRCQRLFLTPPTHENTQKTTEEIRDQGAEQNVEDILSSLFNAPLDKRIQVALELSSDRSILHERIVKSISQLDGVLHHSQSTAKTLPPVVTRQWLERSLSAEQKLRAHMNTQLCALEWLAA